MSATKKSAGGAKATSSAAQSGASGVVEPLHAAGRLFGEIAAELHSVNEVLTEAIQTPEPAAMLIACRALVEKIGAMADRAGRACGDPGVKNADAWLLSPSGAASMGALEARAGAAAA